MRIVLLSVMFRSPNSTAARGGGEISNRLLLEGLSERHKVYIISALGNGMWGQLINGVCYYDIKCSPLLKKIRIFPDLFSKLIYKVYARYLLAKLEPDVVLVSTLEHGIALKYKKKKNVVVGGFIRAYENFSPKPNKNYLPMALKKIVYGDFGKKNVNRMDFILANSAYMKNQCDLEFPDPRKYIVYPPVDAAPKPRSFVTSKEFSISKKIKIGMISNAPHKGFSLFLNLASQFKDVEFHVIGYRSNVQCNRSQFPINLVLHDWSPDPVPNIAEMDLILVPSQWQEPFGRVAVEALQVGTGVLVSDVGGLPEAVGYDRRLIANPNSIEEWKEKIKLALASPIDFGNTVNIAIKHANTYRIKNQVVVLENTLIYETERLGI